jgi:hypothetical protein
MSSQATIDGIKCELKEMGRNINTGLRYFCASRIGRNGKPTKMSRPAKETPTGEVVFAGRWTVL